MKKAEKGDNWLLAKKPFGGNSCASCEAYIGDLKESHEHIAWNKMKESTERLYRLGTGFSKILNDNVTFNFNQNIQNTQNTQNSNNNGNNMKIENYNPFMSTISTKNDLPKLNKIKINKSKNVKQRDNTVNRNTEISIVKQNISLDAFETDGNEEVEISGNDTKISKIYKVKKDKK